MQVGVDSECIVRIGASSEAATRNMAANSYVLDQGICLTHLVSVDLAEKGTTKNFVIVANNSAPTQRLGEAGATEWSFSVQPLRAGNFTLMVRVVAIFKENGEETRRETRLDRPVTVIVSENIVKPPPPPPPSSPPPFRIQFVAANPTESARLKIGGEYGDIQTAISGAQNRDNLQLLQPLLSATTRSFTRTLLADPHILHFSGHGSEEGILFENNEGFGQVVGSLSGVLREVSSLRCVLLNACYSVTLAQAIKKDLPDLHIICATLAVAEDNAHTFSAAFYEGLGANKTIEAAFRFARAAVGLDDSSAADMLVLC